MVTRRGFLGILGRVGLALGLGRTGLIERGPIAEQLSPYWHDAADKAYAASGLTKPVGYVSLDLVPQTIGPCYFFSSWPAMSPGLTDEPGEYAYEEECDEEYEEEWEIICPWCASLGSSARHSCAQCGGPREIRA